MATAVGSRRSADSYAPVNATTRRRRAAYRGHNNALGGPNAAVRVLVCANTPKHVHVYRGVVERLLERGHEVLVLARDYQCTVALCDHFGLPYETYGSLDSTKGSLLRRLPGHYARLLPRAVRFSPDLVFGMGSYAAHAGLVTRAPVVLLLDSEHHPLDHAISHPFADALLTPHAFRKDLGANHYRYRGFMELAYLHPAQFERDPTVRADLGVGDGQFSVVRFNAFGSHHDVGESGFGPDERRELVERLAEFGPVVVSAERDAAVTDHPEVVPYDLHPARIHDVLAEANLLVADTATMVTEAALLCTPAVRSSSFAGADDFGNFHELADAGLAESYADPDEALARAVDLAGDPNAVARWTGRLHAYLSGTTDLTSLVVDVAESGGRVERVPGLSRDPPVDAAARGRPDDGPDRPAGHPVSER